MFSQMRPPLRVAILGALTAVLAIGLADSTARAADNKKDSGSKKAGKPAATKIAVFRMRGTVAESPTSDDGLFGGGSTTTLRRLTGRIRRAATDSSVVAVAFVFEGFGCGPAQAEEIRSAMAEVHKAGKKVYAHSDSISMRSYVLATGADRISVVPTGDIMIMGMYGESPYLRGLFDLLGIEPDFTTCGEFKSAAEMFTRHGPSGPAKQNHDWLIDSLYESMLQQIAQGRGVSVPLVKRWIDHGLYTAERAREAGIIDQVEHRQDFVAFLKQAHGDQAQLDLRYGRKAKKEIDLSSPFGLLKFYAELLSPQSSHSKKPAVAIIHVEGPILPGDASGGGFPLSMGAMAYSTPIRKALDKAAADSSIKAVVLRVNSPGGSAVASEIILDATRRVKAKKPFVVSMGDVAGSGGYYVACAADTIYADRSTITASIGVVSGKLATRNMWTRFGIHWQPTARGERSGMLFSSDPFRPEEKAQLQSWMNEVYEVFKGHVLKSRGERLTKDLEQLAGGRVFTGVQAKKLGLVDRLGTLHDATTYAAKLAKLDPGKYEIRVLPKPKSLIEMLLGDLANEDKELTLSTGGVPVRGMDYLRTNRPKVAEVFSALRTADPRRFRAFFQAWQQLELLQREQILLTTPPLVIW